MPTAEAAALSAGKDTPFTWNSTERFGPKALTAMIFVEVLRIGCAGSDAKKNNSYTSRLPPIPNLWRTKSAGSLWQLKTLL